MTCSKEESFVGKNEREKKVFIPVTYFASYHKFVVRWTSKDIYSYLKGREKGKCPLEKYKIHKIRQTYFVVTFSCLYIFLHTISVFFFQSLCCLCLPTYFLRLDISLPRFFFHLSFFCSSDNSDAKSRNKLKFFVLRLSEFSLVKRKLLSYEFAVAHWWNCWKVRLLPCWNNFRYAISAECLSGWLFVSLE